MGRIVVNFEPGKASAAARPKRRRWPKLLAAFALFVVVAVILAAVGIFFWWRHYQSTPVYSLALMLDAAHRNDTAELAKRIDDDEIAKNMISTINQKAAARYGLAMNATTQQQIDRATSSALPRLKQTIHDELTREIESLMADSQPRPFIYLLLTVTPLVKITTEGDVATAAASAAVSKHPFELTMRRDTDRWKVVGINDDALVQRVVDSMMKDLPPIGPVDSNNPLLKNLGKPRKKHR